MVLKNYKISEKLNSKALLWIIAVAVIIASSTETILPAVGLNTKYFIYFLIGILCAHAYEIDVYRKIALHPAASYAVLIGLTLLFVVFDSIYGPVQIILLSIIFVPIALGNSMYGLLNRPSLLLLGEISYSIYLLHGALLYFTFSWIAPNFMGPATSSLQLSLGMIALGVLLVILSWGTFHVVEKPFIQYGKKINSRIFKVAG